MTSACKTLLWSDIPARTLTIFCNGCVLCAELGRVQIALPRLSKHVANSSYFLRLLTVSFSLKQIKSQRKAHAIKHRLILLYFNLHLPLAIAFSFRWISASLFAWFLVRSLKVNTRFRLTNSSAVASVPSQSSQAI